MGDEKDKEIKNIINKDNAIITMLKQEISEADENLENYKNNKSNEINSAISEHITTSLKLQKEITIINGNLRKVTNENNWLTEEIDVLFNFKEKNEFKEKNFFKERKRIK